MRESRGQWRTARESRETKERKEPTVEEKWRELLEKEKEKEATKKSEVGNSYVR